VAIRFVLARSGEQYSFFLKTLAQSRTLLVSEPFPSEAEARRGIDAVRANASFEGRYERCRAASGQSYFVLKGRKGEPLGRSEMYPSGHARNEGIVAVKAYAPMASVVEET